MKKLFISAALILSMVFATGAFAFGNNQDNNTAAGNYNQQVTGNNNYIGGTTGGTVEDGGIVGQGGAGGNADASATGVGVGIAGAAAKAQAGVVNDNTNVGVNVNRNSNRQGQGQDQDQEQAQKQKQGQAQGMSLNDVGNIKDSFNSESRRGFAIPGDVQLGPNNPGYYVKPTPGAFFESIHKILHFKDTFTESELESMLSGARVETYVSPLYEDGDSKVKAQRTVTFLTTDIEEMAVDPYTQLGFVTTVAKRKATTVQVLAKTGLESLKAFPGKQKLFVVIGAQGAQRMVEASGWGIGLHTSQATISDSQNTSNVTSGGTGYSIGWSEVFDKPWIQGSILK